MAENGFNSNNRFKVGLNEVAKQKVKLTSDDSIKRQAEITKN
jgi:hypothetical protein